MGWVTTKMRPIATVKRLRTIYADMETHSPSMDDDGISQILLRLRDAWPELVLPDGDAEVRATHGQFNDVLLIGDALAVRCPRSDGAAASLRSEVALLRALSGRLPVPIPSPRLISVEWRGTIRDVAAYRMVPGVPLTTAVVAERTPEERSVIAHQLGEFVGSLQVVPRDVLPVDVRTSDGSGDWADLLTALKREVFPAMCPEARERVSASFAAFLSARPVAEFTPVLRHGDLGGENIRFDPASGRISGVIDFGSAALGDPAVDLAALSWYGPEFVDALAADYPALGEAGVMERAEFYRSTHALQQALWAARSGDAEAFEDGLAAYR